MEDKDFQKWLIEIVAFYKLENAIISKCKKKLDGPFSKNRDEFIYNLRFIFFFTTISKKTFIV